MENNTKYITLTDDNFQKEVLESTEPVLVDFWAEWCGPCHLIAPSIEELAEEFKGIAKVGKLNVDNNTHVVSQYRIQSIPAILFFKDGRIVDQLNGIRPKQELAKKLTALA